MANPIPQDPSTSIHTQLSSLLNAWADRRMYEELYQLYDGYRCLNGLTDGVQNCLESLKRVRAMSRASGSQITSSESQTISNLIGLISRTLNESTHDDGG